jgi:hypothetical protein
VSRGEGRDTFGASRGVCRAQHRVINETQEASHDKEAPILMSVARVTEISAVSEQGFEDAINQAIARATKTLRGVEGA